MTVKDIFDVVTDYVEVRDYFSNAVLYSDDCYNQEELAKVMDMEIYKIIVHNEIKLTLFIRGDKNE